jgi:hypothetical protein
VVEKHKRHTSGPMEGDGYYCIYCHVRNGLHMDDCPVLEAEELLK